MAGRPGRGDRAPCRRQDVNINRLNPHLLCMLCGGYYIDATTIIECLHSFCKTCIVRYLETSNYCPQCDVQVHKTRPLLNIRPDNTLQGLVYKLVPGLFTNEMRKRREFFVHNKATGQRTNGPVPSTSSAPPEPEKGPYMEEEKISLSLEYSPDGMPVDDTKAAAEEYTDGTYPSKRYLLCPAAVNLGHLKKFIRLKLNVPLQYKVDIFHTGEPLGDPFTLMDIAHIYSWRRRGPLRLYYCIYQTASQQAKRRKLDIAEEKVMEIVEEKRPEEEPEARESIPPEPAPSEKPTVVTVEYSDISSDDTCLSQPDSGSKGCPEKADTPAPPKPGTPEQTPKENSALAAGPVTVAVTRCELPKALTPPGEPRKAPAPRPEPAKSQPKRAEAPHPKRHELTAATGVITQPVRKPELHNNGEGKVGKDGVIDYSTDASRNKAANASSAPASPLRSPLSGFPPPERRKSPLDIPKPKLDDNFNHSSPLTLPPLTRPESRPRVIKEASHGRAHAHTPPNSLPKDNKAQNQKKATSSQDEQEAPLDLHTRPKFVAVSMVS